MLTVFLDTHLYNYSTKLTKLASDSTYSEVHTKMSNSTSSLLEYEVDQELVEVAIKEFMNKQGETIKKFDNKDF